jgi:hypothetical protein
VLYLDTKKLSLQIIHKDLVAASGHEAVIYSIVTKYLCRAIYCLWIDKTNDDQKDQILDEAYKVDKIILISLSEKAFL